MTYLQRDPDTRLFLRQWGEGRPILFLHGWAINADAWNGPMLHFAERGYRCLAYDRRGHGRSSDPDRGYDFDTLAEDLEAVIDHFDLQDATLVTHSMGAGEAVRYLSRRGTARVSRLVFVGPATPRLRQSPDFPEGIPSAFFEAMRESWRQDFPAWLDENAGPFFGRTVSPATVQWGIQVAEQSSLRALLACNASLEAEDFRDELRRLDLPSLVLHGDADESAPLELTGRPTAALLPRGELKVYAGGPHGLMFSHLDRMNADIEAFLKSPVTVSPVR